MPSSPDRPVSLSPRTPVLGAWLEGWRRVLKAPALSASLLVLTLAMALPLGAALGGMLEEHLGSSQAAEGPAWNWDAGWAAEFAATAQGLGRTFTHEIIGFGGTLRILSGIIDGQPLNRTLAGAAIAYAVVWIFLTGGIVDRLARGRAVRAAGFFAACGGYFGRLLRLGAVMAAVYGALFAWLHPYLFGTLWNRYTRDMTSERDAFLLRLGLYVVFATALFGASLLFDFAKVRLVVEDRRSVLGALGAAARFIRRRPGRTAGLYLLNSLGFLAVLRLWLDVAPAAWHPVTSAFLVTQVYLLARIWLRLAFLASEVVFFQGELAHAGYTARPAHVWPNSAAEDAIETLTKP